MSQESSQGAGADANTGQTEATRSTEQKQETIEQLQTSVQETVESEADVRETVRRLTVEALADGKLDASQVKAVVKAVAEGASKGIDTHGGRARQALEEALGGLEDGLIKAAEASKLALEEAASHAEQFTEQDVKDAFEQLVELEKLYVETLADVARKGGKQAGEALEDLARHARNSGTAIGEYMTEVMTTLPSKLQEAGEWGLKAGLESARTTGAQLAAIASGFLAGIAEALDRQAKGQRDKSEKG